MMLVNSRFSRSLIISLTNFTCSIYQRFAFNALLEKDGSVSIHERNIKVLATEMFKVSKNLAPSQMHEIFKLKDQSQYNLRYTSLFSRPLVKSVYKGTEILSFLGPKIWNILPDT